MLAFSSWTAFFAMGGYAFYVWLAAGLTLLALLSLVIISVQQRRKLLRHITQQHYRHHRRQTQVVSESCESKHE
jgi:heme exporter protein D